jgi:outer membrane lipoprotein SlyB
MTAADGRLLRIDTNNVEQSGSGGVIVNTAKRATGAAVGAVMGALNGAAEGAGISSSLRNDTPTNGFMATKRTVVLPAGTQVAFRLVAPIRVTEPDTR